MSGSRGGRRGGFLATLLATLIFATPLFCAFHSLHGAEVDAAPSVGAAFAQAEGGESSNPHHEVEELCQAGAALTASPDEYKVGPVSVELCRTEASCTSRTPEVPKPVPIPIFTFRA